MGEHVRQEGSGWEGQVKQDENTQRNAPGVDLSRALLVPEARPALLHFVLVLEMRFAISNYEIFDLQHKGSVEEGVRAARMRPMLRTNIFKT